MIAESIIPAISGSISTPASLYIRYIIVQVEPRGWFLKYTGFAVATVPSL